MKYLAHLENNLESKIISIYDVIKGLNGENPIEWEERTYFSLWYNTPMIAKVNSSKRKPHFAFKKGFGGNENSGGGESIEHHLSKKVIYDLKSINIKIGDISDILQFSEVIIEQPFNNRLYKADLYCKIKSENNFNFPFGSMLVVELHSTNKVKKSKQKFCRDNNITSIEVDIWKKIKFEDDIELLQRQLKGYFNKQNFAKILHDPNWKKIVAERKQKEEVLELNKKEEKKQELKRINIQHEQEKLLKERKKRTLEKQSQLNKFKVEHIKPELNKKSIWRQFLDLIFK